MKRVVPLVSDGRLGHFDVVACEDVPGRTALKYQAVGEAAQGYVSVAHTSYSEGGVSR